MSSVFLFHGGGPLPLIQKKEHQPMFEQLQYIRKTYPNPKAIIVFSAHWEAQEWTILDYDNPKLLYDYYGCPPETYNLPYSMSSTAQLRQHVKASLEKNGIALKSEKSRGYDHGVFIPMMLMNPKSEIPVIQISLLKSLDPRAHFEMGLALRDLKNQGYFILGSGASVHGGYGQPQSAVRSYEFDEQLAKVCMSNLDDKQLLQQLSNWRNFKWSSYCHPREQHLIPLFINMGAQEKKKKQRLKIQLMGMHFSTYVFE